MVTLADTYEKRIIEGTTDKRLGASIGVLGPPAGSQPVPAIEPQSKADVMRLWQQARAKLHTEEFEKALHILERIAQREGPSLRSELGKALALRKLGRLEDALAVLESALGLGNDKQVLLTIGVTLHQLRRYPDALAAFDDVAKRWPEDPDVWVYRTAPLMPFKRMAGVLESLEKAHPLRHKASDNGNLLFFCAAMATATLGVTGIKDRWLPDLETGTRAYIKWRERARRDKQLHPFRQGMAALEAVNLSKEDREAFEEFKLSVRLLSIRNPFKGWKALAREVSKVWPQDVSAVDAIREQRRW